MTSPSTQNLKVLGFWVFFLICCSTFSFLHNVRLRLILEYITHTHISSKNPVLLLWKFIFKHETNSKHIKTLLIVIIFSKLALPKNIQYHPQTKKILTCTYLFPTFIHFNKPLLTIYLTIPKKPSVTIKNKKIYMKISLFKFFWLLKFDNWHSINEDYSYTRCYI